MNGFLQDPRGDFSSMRLVFLWVCVVLTLVMLVPVFVWAWHCVFRDWVDFPAGESIAAGAVGIGTTIVGKAWQRKNEGDGP